MMADTRMIEVEKDRRSQSKLRKTVLSARVGNHRLKSPPQKKSSHSTVLFKIALLFLF